MKIHPVPVVLLIVLLFSLLACAPESEEESRITRGIRLSLTDAPVADASGIEGIYITIESIEYNLNNEWVVDENFSGPQKFNLLELTGGTVAPLTETSIPPGRITQIRFMIDAPRRGQAGDNPGCYIAIDPDGVADGNSGDDLVHALFVPSGGQTGYKANGPFTVPADGVVEITADFDVRKSLVLAGGTYILKPTIRLVVNNQAGNISGNFVDINGDSYDTYSIFAYEDGTYNPSEATPSGSEAVVFSNAAGSAGTVDTDGDGMIDQYTIAFLKAGVYDLVIAGVDESGGYHVISTTDFVDVTVTGKATTTRDIDFNRIP